MSTATKDERSASDPSQAAEAATADTKLPFSQAEAERVASLFKPAWEADAPETGVAPTDVAPVADPAAAAAATERGVHPSASSPLEAHLEEVVPEAVGPPQAGEEAEGLTPTPAVVPTTDEHGRQDAMPDQGPVDIVADIPKRTAIQIKDEPSVVLHDDPMPASTTLRHAAAQVQAPPPPAPKRSRNMVVVVGVLAVAALVVVVVGISSLMSGSASTGAADRHTTTNAPTTTPDRVPVATPEDLPLVGDTPNTRPEPAEPVNETVVRAHADEAGMTSRANADAPNSAKTAAPQGESDPPAAAKPPRPSAPTATGRTTPKPRKTSASPAATKASPRSTSKAPAGGIVRDTPF